MLLMGDRTPQVAGYLSTGFDNIGGAGKLRLRTFGSAGIDAPGDFASGDVCVGNGQTVTLNVNGGSALDADVDYIKAVSWWYDHDQDEDEDANFDKIRMRLERQNGGSWDVIAESDTDDNRQRVYASGAGGYVWRISYYGRQVDSDGEGCNSDSMKVYYARIYEENDRDDDADLTDFIRPEP